MADATARYVIAADDKSHAAISSVMRNLKSLEKGVKSTAQVLNASLGFFVGAKLAQSFKAVFRATAESEAGQKGFAQALAGTKLAFEQLMIGESGLPAATKSMEELQTILKDPGIVAAADALTGAMIRGFSAAALSIAQTVGGLREIGVQLGLFEAKGQQEMIDRLDAQIDKVRAKIRRRERNLEHSGQSIYRDQIQAEIDALRKEEEALLAAQQKIIDHPPPLPKEKKTGEQLDAEREAEKKAQEAAKKAAEKVKKEADDLHDYMRAMSRETNELIAADFKDSEDTRKESEEARAADAERVKKANEELLAYQRELRDEEAQAEEDRLKQRVTVFTDAFKGAYEDIVRTGKFSVREFVQFMIAEFARKQLFKQIDLIGEAIDKALRPRTGAGGGGKGSFWSALLSGIGAVFSGASGGTQFSGASPSSVPNPSIGTPPYAGIMHAQHGADFQVGGSGGTDSQLVAFKATPGERVQVTPQGQSGGAPTVVINNNIDARGATQDAVNALPAILERNNAALETKIVEGLRRRKYSI